MARTAAKCCAASLVEILADLRQLLDDRLVFRNLAVEHAQRIRLGTALAVGAHLVYHRLQRLAQSLVVAGAVVGAADGVQLQSCQPRRPTSSSSVASISSTSASRAGDSLPAARRPDDLGADLEELAIAALLRTLAAELRADVIELLQRALIVRARARCRRAPRRRCFPGAGSADCAFSLCARALSSQVNISLETMSVSSPTLREKSCGVFEDRRANLVEVVAREDVAHLRLHPVPQVGVGREKVAGSSNGFDHKNVSMS